MADGYQKTTWIDQIIDPESGQIIQQGTRFTAEKMNKIEQGIANAHNLVNNAETVMKQYTDERLDELIAAAPAALNTLKELSDALGADPNFATTITNLIGTKASQIDFDSHRSDYTLQIPWGGTTTNSGNVYSLSNPAITSLKAGMAVSFSCNADASGAVKLNWFNTGAKNVIKPNGVAITNWKKDGIYTVRYDGTNFRSQGSDSSGNATPADLLAGKTASTDEGDIVGSIPNFSGVSKDAVNLYSDGSGNLWLSPQQGYYTGASAVRVYDPNHISANIVAGKSILGVQGTFNSRQLQVMHNVMAGSPITFDLSDGSVKDKAYIQVTGLTATPVIIIINAEDYGAEMSSYNYYASLFNGYRIIRAGNYWFRVAGQCYVNSTGFRIPIDDENVSRHTVTIIY